MNFVEAITRKRDGFNLDKEQIEIFVNGASSGDLPPEQLAAMLMAICCRGMSDEETHFLTEAMLHSGEMWDLAATRPDVVDKHSTGGVGDTVSLILAPLLAAVGTPVAMMAGRGLGHSQGTLDKLEAIPGFCFDKDRNGTLELIDNCGVALVAQTREIAPADRVLYGMRDITGTVPSLPLIVGSIMSKKLALGAGSLILDVKWGRGAFRKTIPDAVELASALRAVARAAGCRSEAVITDMNQPLAPFLGTACEVRAANDVLDGGGDAMLREASIALSAEALVLGGESRESARRRLEDALDDGSAASKWDEVIAAHGGDADRERLALPNRVVEIASTIDGLVTGIDAEALGWAAVAVGAGRRFREETIAHGAGIEIHARLGQRVGKGEKVASLLVGDREIDEAVLVAKISTAFEVGPEEINPPELIVGCVDEVVTS